ncbi:MAG: hypothetical protein KZQ70_15760 [gamma proteobacterium symbiont of Lucinoma myriamae]|nr:hypothetical protein [gamma proteobacterium symbiont of Lucinoma myriamae]
MAKIKSLELENEQQKHSIAILQATGVCVFSLTTSEVGQHLSSEFSLEYETYKRPRV